MPSLQFRTLPKSLSKPAINLNGRVSRKEALTMSRVGLALYTDKPAAIYASASENRAKIVQLGISNHADLNTATLYMDVMRDVQPGTTIFIGISRQIPDTSNNLIIIYNEFIINFIILLLY